MRVAAPVPERIQVSGALDPKHSVLSYELGSRAHAPCPHRELVLER